MNGCPPGDFSGQTECGTVQLIEPDGTLLVASSSGSTDASLDERGDLPLDAGTALYEVIFVTPKAGDNYRFEYLYVDCLNENPPTSPTVVLPIIQSVFGFLVKVTPPPPDNNFILRWRVVLIELGISGQLNFPETIYLQLPQQNVVTVMLVNPHSDNEYHFSEMRVENLTDPVSIQTPIAVQVVVKTQTSFTIGLNPTPPTPNYYLSASIPLQGSQ